MFEMSFLDAVQWPAMLVTVVALDDSIAKEVQEELGILAISRKQCVVDYLGPAGWRLRAYSLAGMPGLFECQGRGEESLGGNLVPVTLSTPG